MRMCPRNNAEFGGFLHVIPLYPTKELQELKNLPSICHHSCIRSCACILHLNFLVALHTMNLLYSCCSGRIKVFACCSKQTKERSSKSNQQADEAKSGSCVGFSLGLEFVHYMTTGRSHLAGSLCRFSPSPTSCIYSYHCLAFFVRMLWCFTRLPTHCRTTGGTPPKALRACCSHLSASLRNCLSTFRSRALQEIDLGGKELQDKW